MLISDLAKIDREYFNREISDKEIDVLNNFINHPYEDINNYLEISLLKEMEIKCLEKEIKDKEDLVNEFVIENIVFFISHSAEQIYEFDFSPIDMTLKMFKDTKNILFFYTNETENICKRLAEKNKEKYNVICKKIELYSFNSIYNIMFSIINDVNMNQENSFIDITLGIKMVSFAFYKLSVETGIRTINWKRIEIRDKKNKPRAIPGTKKAYIVEFPKLENYKLYKSINKAINNFKFEIVASKYENVNNNLYAFVYNKLASLFNLELLSCFDEFCDEIEVILKEIKENKNIKNEYDLFVFKKVFFILELILKGKKNKRVNEDIAILDIELYEKYDILKVLNISKDNEEYIYTTEFAYIIFRLFSIEFFKRNINKNAFHFYKFIINIILEEDNYFIKNIKEDKNKDKLNKSKEFYEKLEILKDNYIEILIEKYFVSKKEINDLLLIFKQLTEKIDDKIMINEEKIVIPKVDIQIYLNEYNIFKDLLKTTKRSIVQQKFFNNLFKNKKITSEDLTKIIDELYETKSSKNGNNRKFKSDIKTKIEEKVKFLNTYISKKIESKLGNFILKENINSSKNWQYIINEKYYMIKYNEF